jgi:adenosylcobinamide amidohydrolase
MTRLRVMLDRPWLTLDLGQPLPVLSWALNRPGLVMARRIVWREVRDADLPEGFDVGAWLAVTLTARGEADSVAFLTSRDLGRYRQATAQVGAVSGFALATVGLSNAERVGHRRPVAASAQGTINIAVHLDAGLTEAARLEALSIAVQARTAAILDVGIPAGERSATGTGTDCLAVAAPSGNLRHAGLHTDVGEAVGRAVYDAVRAGAEDWKREAMG